MISLGEFNEEITIADTICIPVNSGRINVKIENIEAYDEESPWLFYTKSANHPALKELDAPSFFE